MNNQTKPALEDSADGQVRKEIESVIFARVDLTTVLPIIEKLAIESEIQEQYEFLYGSGSFRTRKSSKYDQIHLTGKSWTPGIAGKDEVTDPVSEGMFEIFKKLAVSGLHKTRYKIIIPNTANTWPNDHFNYGADGSLFWEVDVVHRLVDGENEPIEWLKIDLEVPDPAINFRDYDLPFPVLDKMDKQISERTPEETEWVKNLYSVIFNYKTNSIANASIEELTPSLEGFFDPIINLGKSVGKWWDDWQKNRILSRPMPDSENRESTEPLRKILKEVRKTYGNKTWIGAREFVEGTVDLNGIVSYLYIGSQEFDPSLFAIYESAMDFRKLVKKVEKDSLVYNADIHQIWKRIQKLPIPEARRESKYKARDLSAFNRIMLGFNTKLPLPNQMQLEVVGDKLLPRPTNTTLVTVKPTVSALHEQNIYEVVTYLLDSLEAMLDCIDTAVRMRRNDWIISRHNDDLSYYNRLARHWGYWDKSTNTYTQIPSEVETTIALCEELQLKVETLNHDFWCELVSYYTKQEIMDIVNIFRTEDILDNVVDGVSKVLMLYKQAGIVMEKYIHRSIVK
jgi:hypothetical protein